MDTYKLFVDVITAKKFKLDAMRERIQRCYIEGYIDATEYDELNKLSVEYANAEAERPEMIEMLKTLYDRIENLENKIEALKNGESGSESNTEKPTYEKWVPWDGISKRYQYGDIVEHNGKLWENILKDKQNTWEPGVPGTESLWKVYER
jgi:hypothetical protein